MVYAVAIGVLFALPGAFVLLRTFQLGGDLGGTVTDTLPPLWRTVQLALAVSVTTTIVGTWLAWLIVRTDLPAARFWQVVVVLPLVLPSFVGAAAFLAAVAPGGVLHDILGRFGLEPPTRLRGFWPAWLALSAFTYPYVFLPVAARLRALRPSLEESARLLGRSPFSAFAAVTLPQLRPAMLAGGLLVFLYTVSDFGAVQLLGYDTLTRVIFATRLTDRATSFAAATVLMAVALVAVLVARRAGHDVGVDEEASMRRGERQPLGRATIPAVASVLLAVVVGLILPIASLGTWAVRGWRDGRVDVGDLAGPFVNTAVIGVVTAVVAVAVVFPLAIVAIRHRSSVASAASVAVIAGFAVPGIVIALSLVFWALNTPGVATLYQTFPLLVGAYVIHFGSQALASSEVAVRAVPDRLRESGKLLTPSRWYRRRVVEYPLMRSGLASGAGLVMLSTVKELPATLLLAPIGFETLATEVWGSFEEGFYAEAGMASLALVVLSGVLTWLLVLRASEG